MAETTDKNADLSLEAFFLVADRSSGQVYLLVLPIVEPSFGYAHNIWMAMTAICLPKSPFILILAMMKKYHEINTVSY